MPSQKPIKILQASAGSGKTFNLTAHYLTLLFDGETKYREVLAVTFTNKATEEMKSRILEVLKGLAEADEAVETFRLLILQTHTNLNTTTLQQLANRIYRRILHDYSRFAINTIDGFVQKVIRSFTFELGLDAGYKLELNTGKVKRELANKLNEQLDQKPELLKWIINLALERVRDNKSWNYRDELIKLADEIFKERYQPFENALRLVDPAALFSDLQSATKQIISVFEEEMKTLCLEANAIFQHSGVLLQQLAQKSNNPLKYLERTALGEYVNVKKYLFKLIDNPDCWQKSSLTAEVSALYDDLQPILKSIDAFYSTEFANYQMAKAIDANLYYLRLMQEMAGLLKEYREENSTLLISDAQNLLKGITGDQHGNPSFIWEKMGNRYRHFLFDEFQDTSTFQWDNFLPLLKNAMAEANGKLIDHLIVGDVKQSIYRWRNGDWRILHRTAKAHIGQALVLDDDLKENYRSASNIIDFNNFLFRHSPDALQNHINAKVIEEGSQEFFDDWWKSQGYDDIITKAYSQSQQLKAVSTPIGGCIDISFLEVKDNKHRASQVKTDALEYLSDKLKSWLEIEIPLYQAGQICILVRSNGEARLVVEHLMANNIPVISGEALLIANNSAVRLILNTLRAMVGKKDQITLYKANCVFLYAKQHGKPIPPSTWLLINNLEPQKLQEFLPASLCANWSAWQQLPLTELVEQLIGAYNLAQNASHLPYLLAFRDLVSNFAKQGERGITTFLHWWQEEGESKALSSSEQSNAVQVMTVHKSKGLAFDVVMLPFCSWNLDGMSNSIFWVDTVDTPYAMLNSAPVHYKKSLGQSAFAKAYFEELLFNYMDALNVLYVAVTRTRNHLYITAPSASGSQFTLAGDLIMQPLMLHAAELNTEFENDAFTIHESVAKKQKKAVVSLTGMERFIEKNWSFISYPLSNRLNDALTDKKVFEQLDLLSGNTSQRRGVILHEALARVQGIENLQIIISQMQFEGWFRKSEEVEIFTLAESVLNQPELKEILAKPYANLSEQTIISKAGESYRPDKVLIGSNEVLIVDFKFTGEPKRQHIEQVEQYRSLLLEMGYQNIKGYLYYGYLQQLKAV